MKCEHCNNDMVWVGSLRSGRMTCYHCELTGDCKSHARANPILLIGSSPTTVGHIHISDGDMDFMDYDI